MWQSQLRNITQIEPFGDNINKLKTIPPPSLNYRLVTARQTEEKEEKKRRLEWDYLTVTQQQQSGHRGEWCRTTEVVHTGSTSQ